MSQNTATEFLQKLTQSVENKEFIKLTLSKPTKNTEWQSVYIRCVEIKEKQLFSFIYRYARRDETKNYTLQETEQLMANYLPTCFLCANLFTTSADFELKFNSKNQPVVLKRPATLTLPITLQHDKEKHRFVNPKNNKYLQLLGITMDNGEVRKDKNDKFRQINKYIEIVDSLLHSAELPQPFRVADMGAGKGYLTFALYDYLCNVLHKQVVMTGVEREEKMVNQCNQIAKECGFEGLHFETGDISQYAEQQLDMLIALHACDTATDDALFKGIKSSATIIVTAPCCHKQIRRQIKTLPNLSPMLKFGILEERQCEIITDSIRGLLLEYCGYSTNVFEFISSEHTAKNVMITAVKHKNTVDKSKIIAQINNIKLQFGIEFQQLEKFLGI